MRRRYVLLSFWVVVLLACQAVALVFPSPTLTPTAPPTATVTLIATSTPTQPVPQVTTPASAPHRIANGGFEVRTHPDGGLYVGDQVSFEILAPENYIPENMNVTLSAPGEVTLGPYEFGQFGIAHRPQATLFWAWDTSSLIAGAHELTFEIQPLNLSWTETFNLLPRDTLPQQQAQAGWVISESECCLVYTISGTEAERDLPELLALIDNEYEDVHLRLPAELDEPLSIFLVPRVVGHGGFAGQELSVSYLDRNYAGGTTRMVLHHEIVHYLDGRLGGELRPTFLIEGLAVYLSGGHFKPEPLLPRAAALLDLGDYLPLASMTDDFYLLQHESSYLLAGALVEYMVDRWGWEAFENFYRDIHPVQDNDPGREEPPRRDNDPGGEKRPEPGDGGLPGAVNTALLAHFDLTLEGLEDGFLEALRLYSVTQELREDVRLTIEYYDTVRRYQLALDPSAHYLTAWLPDMTQMRERNLVADYLRHPSAPENLLLESMLIAADQNLRTGEYPSVEEILKSVNGILESLPKPVRSPLSR